MKNQKNNILLICLMLFLVPGCSNFGAFSKGSANGEETEPPKILTAKMLENIPIPADAKIIEDQKSENRFWEEERIIQLESSELVYDVSHFFRQEMEKNGWTGDERNERNEEDRRSIISDLNFSNAGAKAEITILATADDGSEIKITVNKKLDLDIPLHECAREPGRINKDNNYTLRVNCWENLSALAQFYSEEFPKKGWTLANHPEESAGKTERKLVKIAFAKGNMNAVVSLLELGIDRTSVKITITK